MLNAGARYETMKRETVVSVLEMVAAVRAKLEASSSESVLTIASLLRQREPISSAIVCVAISQCLRSTAKVFELLEDGCGFGRGVAGSALETQEVFALTLQVARRSARRRYSVRRYCVKSPSWPCQPAT